MNNKEFLKYHPLTLIYYGDEAKIFRKILKEANRSYVFACEEEKDDGCVIFNVCCPTTSFATAYWHLGILIEKNLLSKRKK